MLSSYYVHLVSSEIGRNEKGCIIKKKTIDTFRDFKIIFSKPETIFQFYSRKHLGKSETMKKNIIYKKVTKIQKESKFFTF